MSKADDLTLPKSTVAKVFKESLPAKFKGLSPDTQELIMNCCIEFIHLLASEANDACTKKNKKTIGGEHIIEALQELGFGDYCEEVQKALVQHKTVQSARPKGKNKLKDSGFTEEELHAQQMELFAKAKNSMAPNNANNNANNNALSASGGLPNLNLNAFPPPIDNHNALGGFPNQNAINTNSNNSYGASSNFGHSL